MLFWILLGVGLGALGLAALGLLTFRLWRQVRRLGHDVAAAGERLATASRELQRVAPPR